MLEKINTPEDVKNLNLQEKKQLAEDIRKIHIRSSFTKWWTFSFKFRSCRANYSST